MSKSYWINNTRIDGDISIENAFKWHGHDALITCKIFNTTEDFKLVTEKGNNESAMHVAIVESLMSNGKRLFAIQYVKQVTGWGLTDCKNFIDENYHKCPF